MALRKDVDEPTPWSNKLSQVVPLEPQTRHDEPAGPRIATTSNALVHFSWMQCLVAIFAYVWLFSNYIRTGGASNLDAYQAIEPDLYVNFGPYAYPVNTYVRANDSTSIAAIKPPSLWIYKYDTTSLAMRAFAEYLNLTTFPDCVMYRTACQSDTLPPATVFAMLDELFDGVRDNIAARSMPLLQQTSRPRLLPPATIVLKAHYEYYDRVHHYLIPPFFTSPLWRTCRAMYYSSARLDAATSSDINNPSSSATLGDLCSPAYGKIRPFFCDELWASFARACRRGDTECAAVGRMTVHIANKLQKLQTAHPNATVDLLVLEGAKDLSLHRGGFVHVGKRNYDIVTIFRVRSCINERCETRLIDDYRYEGETCVTDITGWYSIVTILRGASQTYYWIRVATLFLGCYLAVSERSGASDDVVAITRAQSHLRRWRAALALFFKVPSQVVIYGSAFPLVCYLLAHAIDSTMVYELIVQRFDSINGLMQLSITELITISSVQMRNVWVLGGAAHLVVRIATQRMWTPLDGIWGMPQFSIALISALTIVSMFRFISLRHAPILEVLPIEIHTPVHPLLESFVGPTYGGGGKSTAGGLFIDVKAVGCSAVLLFVAGAICVFILRRVFPSSRLVFWRSHSLAPLTAGVLWPTTALAVSWNDDPIVLDRTDRSRLANLLAGPTVVPLDTAHAEHTQRAAPVQLHGDVEHSITSLDDYSEHARATFYLMNVAILTDPITYIVWRWYCHRTLFDVVRSSETHREYFVPHAYVESLNWDAFTWLRTVRASEMSWRDAIACG